jgi:hypothetical protein
VLREPIAGRLCPAIATYFDGALFSQFCGSPAPRFAQPDRSDQVQSINNSIQYCRPNHETVSGCSPFCSNYTSCPGTPFEWLTTTVSLIGTAPWRICIFGVLWIAFAPIIFFMAAIAKVESDLTYTIHLVAFTAVAVAAEVCGVGALLRHHWGGVGLRWISMLVATYHLVMAGLGILWPSQAGPVGRLILFAIVAPTAVPFLWMASSLGRLLKRPDMATLETSAL